MLSGSGQGQPKYRGASRRFNEARSGASFEERVGYKEDDDGWPRPVIELAVQGKFGAYRPITRTDAATGTVTQLGDRSAPGFDEDAWPEWRDEDEPEDL